MEFRDNSLMMLSLGLRLLEIYTEFALLLVPDIPVSLELWFL